MVDFRCEKTNEVISQEAWQHVEIDFTHKKDLIVKGGFIPGMNKSPEKVENNNNWFGCIEYKFRDVQNILIKSDEDDNTAIIQFPYEDELFNFNSHARNLNNNEIIYMIYRENGDITSLLYISELHRLPKIEKDNSTYHPLFLENKYTIQSEKSFFDIFADDMGKSSPGMKIRLSLHRLLGFLPLLYLHRKGLYCCVINKFQNRDGRQELEIIVPNGWLIKERNQEYFIKTQYDNTLSQNMMVHEAGYDPAIGKHKYLIVDYSDNQINTQYKCEFLLAPRAFTLAVSFFLTIYTIVPAFLLILSFSTNNHDDILPLMACIIASINISVWSYFTFRTMISKGVVFLNENGPSLWVKISIFISLTAVIILFIKFFGLPDFGQVFVSIIQLIGLS